MVPPKVSKKKVFIEETKIFENVKIKLICTFMDLQNTELSVRGGCIVSIVQYTYRSSASLCMYLKIKSDARLFHIFCPW